MRDGFYPALGTPLDEMGNLLQASFRRHIEDQIEAGAAGLLALGSMGIQANLKSSEYASVARTAAEATKGACPLFVGVMDNSIERVLERIESLRGLPIDGVVATTPFYYGLNQLETRRFFEGIAARSPYPLYLYDLPGVTKTKIEAATATYLMNVDNIAGIKTGDMTLARTLHRLAEGSGSSFRILFSGLDVFDAAYGYGLIRQLDGMFSCTASIAGDMYKALSAGRTEEAGRLLDHILQLRDEFLAVGVFGGFSHAMNLLGYEGVFAPDYASRLDDAAKDRVKQTMLQLRLI